MLGLLVTILHIVVFSFLGWLFYLMRKRFSLLPFFLYLGALMVYANILGVAYSITVLETIRISGGNIAYGAEIWCFMLLYVMERDPTTMRATIFGVFAVSIFFVVMYTFLPFVLSLPVVVNPLPVPPEIFQASLWIVIVGGALAILELATLIAIIERTKDKFKWMPSGLRFAIILILILCLDGLLFPLLTFPLYPSLYGTIVGGLEGKALLGLFYGITLMIATTTLNLQYTMRFEGPRVRLKEIISLSKAEMAQELRIALKDSKENEKIARLLIDLISHDICNYDQAALSQIEMLNLLIDSKDTKLKKLISSLKRTITESARVVTNVNMLNFIREKGMKPENVDLSHLFEAAVEGVSENYCGVSLRVEGLEKLYGVHVHAHPLLQECFYNILSNSIKYQKEGEEVAIIEVDIRKEGDKHHLLIGDHGIGIPDSRKELVFRRFDGTPYGSGMGLSIVKSMAAYFDGEVWVENRSDFPDDHTHGTIFHFLLQQARDGE